MNLQIRMHETNQVESHLMSWQSIRLVQTFPTIFLYQQLEIQIVQRFVYLFLEELVVKKVMHSNNGVLRLVLEGFGLVDSSSNLISKQFDRLNAKKSDQLFILTQKASQINDRLQHPTPTLLTSRLTNLIVLQSLVQYHLTD